MNRLLTQLKNIGLTSSQAKIYLALLRMEKATVLKVSKETGIKRTTVYDHIRILSNFNLVSTSYDEYGKKYFYARSPENLKHIVEEKAQKVEILIPELTRLKDLRKGQPKVEVLSYKQALERFYNHLFSSSAKVVKALGDPRFKDVSSDFPLTSKQGMRLSNKRVSLGIWSYNLASERILEPIYQEYYNPENNRKRLRRSRYLTGLDKLENTFILASDYLLLLPPEDEEYGILINSKTYVQSFERLYEYYWVRGKDL